ncbi:transcriptional regulator [Candidatus Scalindua japonica]|uniref:Transcriptional regulator n=1 Tax=Candidatus Scalindua japonica TaxID=1284222 RepID=A0A286TU21_9BACT|nr:hypothetical protein [Candidatus Scalindua japonica]GAX59364.1 transcriptional regulator [Candidatus Scalindua japonica]
MKMKLFVATIFIVLMFLESTVSAQYTIVIDEIDVPPHVVQKVAEDKNCSTSDDFASITGSEYLDTAKKLGEHLSIDKTTINVDIKGLFAAETVSQDNKITMVFNGKFNMIMWDMKKVIQMTPAEIEGMAKQAENMMGQMQKNMPDISKLLDGANLTPEQKAAAMQAMPGMFNNKNVPEPESAVKATDKTRTITGMPATLYLIKDGNTTKGIWASDVDKRLADKYEEVGKSFDAMTPMKKEKKKEWELLPGKYPLETVEVNDGGYRGPKVGLRMTKEIRRGNPPEKAYYVPGSEDGFQVGGTELLMSGFMKR